MATVAQVQGERKALLREVRRRERAVDTRLETIERRHSIQGVCGLGICWEDLAEIKSLAVSKDLRRKGYGKELVETCLNEARVLGLRKVFTLTYIPEFFVKLGFQEVEKQTLPHKIWADCLKCPKFPNCDEVALVTHL